MKLVSANLYIASFLFVELVRVKRRTACTNCSADQCPFTAAGQCSDKCTSSGTCRNIGTVAMPTIIAGLRDSNVSDSAVANHPAHVITPGLSGDRKISCCCRCGKYK